MCVIVVSALHGPNIMRPFFNDIASIIVTLRGGGGPGHDVKKKINFQKMMERVHESIMENPTP